MNNSLWIALSGLILTIIINVGAGLYRAGRITKTIEANQQEYKSSLASLQKEVGDNPIASQDDDGKLCGYSINNYVGLLHGCINELVARIEKLETINRREK